MNWTYKEFRKYITVTAIEGVQVTIDVDKIACYYEDLENKLVGVSHDKQVLCCRK